MKIIIGLGNPGSEYAHTRHNIGFEVIDELSAKYRISLTRSKFNALFGKGTIDGEEVLLVKPLTYMNASGEAVGPLTRFYKLTAEDLIAVHDDMDLPVGKIRLRQKGGSGGHNGVKSLIQHLHTQEFARIRVGVGHPERSRQAVVNYVLNGFTEEEKAPITEAVERASEAAAAWLTIPFPKVMSEYNANK
ncbi:aminoacyl-tRNA hydrolase [Sporolactobacillus pectinivorans]|uniref:aminoacyl-tRNA hydrolase n=1 Tax=Sporolactobacillus pectinivorans TaxID=1591408 RepID=UPI000C25B688|nr:aminoacyl-tRNA hydrolase [Sporolactobacillus pectinivorans]